MTSKGLFKSMARVSPSVSPRVWRGVCLDAETLELLENAGINRVGVGNQKSPGTEQVPFYE
jgi:hypothetical protein